jgi:hypothetical protein
LVVILGINSSIFGLTMLAWSIFLQKVLDSCEILRKNK